MSIAPQNIAKVICLVSAYLTVEKILYIPNYISVPIGSVIDQDLDLPPAYSPWVASDKNIFYKLSLLLTCFLYVNIKKQ